MRLPLLVVLAALLLAPAGALAQSSPFQPLPSAPPEQPAPVAPGGGQDDGGISGLQQGLLIFAGIGLVLGIGYLIARDAKRNAPAEPRGAPGTIAGAAPGTVGERKKPDPRAAAKQKAAAKRARQARKKNRPVRK